MEDPKNKGPKEENSERTITRITVDFRDKKGQTLQEALEKAPK